MWDKTVIVLLSIILILAACFGIYQDSTDKKAQTEKKLLDRTEFKSQGPSENEYKKYWSNVWTVMSAII